MENPLFSAAEADLISALQRRDLGAFAQLYDTYTPVLLRAICLSVRDRATAEALLPAAFVAIWQGVEQYDAQQERFVHYLLRTARATATSHLRIAVNTPKRPVF